MPGSSTTSDSEPCDCGLDGEWEMCINGIVYGECGSQYCYGVCAAIGNCGCDCHKL